MSKPTKNSNLSTQARQFQWPTRVFRDMAVGRKGAVVIIVALTMVPLLLMAGGAIDFARFYVAKARVQYALDEALLAAGASDPTADRTAVFNKYFAANLSENSLGTTTVVPPTFGDPSSETSASATLTVPTLFLNLASIDKLVTTTVASISVTRTGLEVALVVDNSGSMRDSSKLSDLKIAAHELKTTLFDSAVDPGDVKMAVVPFVATVNIGTGNVDYVKDPGHTYPPGTVWKGCVEARAQDSLVKPDHDTNDLYESLSADDAKWPPYFAQSESDDLGDYVVAGTTYSGLPSGCANTWWDPAVAPTANPRPVGPTGHAGDNNGVFPADGTYRTIDEDALGGTNGPNTGCPTPITPLTDAKSAITAAIDALEAWDNNGTMINLGAVWGWRVLSQNEPFTEGVPYSDTNVNKAIILLTDGRNQIAGQPAPLCTTIYDDNRYSSQYTAYGYLSENRTGTTNIFSAEEKLNDRLKTACDGAKSKGITIFTVVFGDDIVAGSPVDEAMKDCATSPSHHIPAADGAKLKDAFSTIGARLVNLRLSK